MLTLDKAIEICSLDLTYTYPARYDDLQEAIKLLIEAGKRFKALREVIRVPYTDPLPGEDPETATTRSLHHIRAVLENPLGKEPKPTQEDTPCQHKTLRD
ncbi:hypothetical protein ES708_03916 [subsurface metagenome]